MKTRNKLLTILTLSMSSTAFAGGANDHSHMHGDMHGAGAQGGMEHWMSPPAEQQRPNPIDASQASIARGADLFRQNCATCHGANAEGDGPAGMALNPKPTNLRAMSGGHADGDFAWKIKHGRGAMPAWGATLGEEKIWHLVNYIQSLGQHPAAGKVKNDDHGHADGHAHGH